MQAAVAAVFGELDVVFLFNQAHIVLLQQAVGQQVDIIHEAADDAHPRDIEEVFFDALQGEGLAAAQQLFVDAGHGFDAALQSLDAAAALIQRELLIQYAEFGLYLPHGAAVIADQLARIIRHLPYLFGRRFI